MSKTAHTKGPWQATGPVVTADGFRIAQTHFSDNSDADARLIAAAPDLLAELRETADWLDERAKVLRELIKDVRPGGRVVSQALRDEAARFEGRATVIRQTILEATQGA